MLVLSGAAVHPATGGLGFVSGSCEGPAGVKAALTCRLLPPSAAAELKKNGRAALDVLLSSRRSRFRSSSLPGLLHAPQPGASCPRVDGSGRFPSGPRFPSAQRDAAPGTRCHLPRPRPRRACAQPRPLSSAALRRCDARRRRRGRLRAAARRR